MFINREHAGTLLAHALRRHPALRGRVSSGLIVLSIPRGGVVVGGMVADTLDCDHDVIVVKKIGFPGQLEFAAGAMAEDGEALLNADVIAPYRYDPYFMHDLRYQIARTRAQIAYQISEFRQGRRLHLSNATIILVDDGIATGETVKAAVHWLRAQPASNFPESIIVAAPVCSPNTAADLRLLADEVICVAFPNNFRAVGQFYQRFDQTSDDEVKRILAEQRQKA